MQLNPKTLSTTQRMQLISAAERSLVANPKNAEALSNIGILYFHEKRYNEAIDYLKRSFILFKKNKLVMEVLAECLYQTLQYKESAKFRRKLCELEPRNAIYWAQYAEILPEIDKNKQAEQAFDKAERFAPNNPNVMYQRADFLRRQGKYDQANEILVKIQEIEPGHPESLYLYTHSRKFNESEAQQYSKYVDQALPKAIDKPQISNLNYAGGKVWQDAGDADKAFAYYKSANDERLKELNPKFIQPFLNTKSVFTKQFIADRAQFGDQTNAPIYILGMVRSGTTLTESLCGAHSKVLAGDEMVHVTSIMSSLGLNTAQTNTFTDVMHKYSDDDIVAMKDDYLSRIVDFQKKSPHFTDKLPANFMNIGFIRTILPNAKIIHCKRHPIDNCLSIYTNSMRSRHIAYKSDLTQLGLYYRQYWQLMQHWREHIKDGFHEVYYEDMVTNTELNARKMIEYLDLDWEDSVMNREGSQKNIRTLSAWQARQPIYTSSAGKWRKYEKHLAPLIDALGSVVDEYEAELEALQTKVVQTNVEQTKVVQEKNA